jgi:hypothetical protein
MRREKESHESPQRESRRMFLSDVGMGFAGLALGAMLQRDGIARADVAATHSGGWQPPNGFSHFAPRAKSVIWFFMVGGTSQMESFDPKPALNQYANKTIAETPFAETLNSPYLKKNLRELIEGLHQVHPKVFPMQVGYGKRGDCGAEMSDWWPCLGECVDDLAIVRSMWTTDNNHGAQLQFHTGRHVLEGDLPTIGAWVHYGLGSLNDNLPQFVVMGTPIADCCGGAGAHGANYLGPEHSGVELAVDPREPLPFAGPGSGVYREEQQAEFQLLDRLHRLARVEYPDDPAARARIKSYELAFRMQTAVPGIMDFDAGETAATHKLYGLDRKETQEFGRQCLAARRLVEKGVRFVQIFHGSNGGAGHGMHSGLKKGPVHCAARSTGPSRH